MEQQVSSKTRRELENKMLVVFKEKMQTLPADLRKVLADDLVTAFESRLSILRQAQPKIQFFAAGAEEAKFETVQT